MKIPTRHRAALSIIAAVILFVAIHESGAHSEGYKFLEQAIRTAPSVREQLGDVKSVGLSLTGTYNSSFVGDDKWVTMKLKVSGQKGSGIVAASAKKINGVWSVTKASLDGRPISLNKTVDQ